MLAPARCRPTTCAASTSSSRRLLVLGHAVAAVRPRADDLDLVPRLGRRHRAAARGAPLRALGDPDRPASRVAVRLGAGASGRRPGRLHPAPRPSRCRPLPPWRRGAARASTRGWRRTSGSRPLLDPEDLPGAADSGHRLRRRDLASMQEAFLASPYADRSPVGVEVPFSLVLGGRVVPGRIDAVLLDRRRGVGPLRGRRLEDLHPAGCRPACSSRSIGSPGRSWRGCRWSRCPQRSSTSVTVPSYAQRSCPTGLRSSACSEAPRSRASPLGLDVPCGAVGG